MRKIISLICLLLPIQAYADQLQIREDAPDRHVVVKGDTLWDISATFFKDPWKWPQIWGLNKDTIKDPHWIYPGDVVYLDRSTGTLKVGEPQPATAASAVAPVNENNENVVKLSPRARELPNDHDAIPPIPLKDIRAFLSKPLVVETDEDSNTPTLVGTYEQRELLSTDDLGYVKNMPEDKGVQWQIYRLGRTFVDPDTDETLGHEVVYLGDARVEKFGPLSQVRITRALSEIAKGDYLAVAQSAQALPASFTPHAPATDINATVISIYGGMDQAGQNSIITLNRGQRDGLEPGHVLALYQKGEVLKRNSLFKKDGITLPDMRYGLVFVFRVFHKVSYALVLETRLPVQLLDTAKTP